MIREIQYKTFSLRTHRKNWGLKQPNVCQFELTFGCGLRCRHCYTDCYNRPAYLKKELDTKQVKTILDKVQRAGIIWLCFTGGDPLTRRDFLEIYASARAKGFIITIFTNGYSMTDEIARYLEKCPPFVIELTLNAVTEDVYEKISRAKGSFDKAMQGINLILKRKLPLAVKTQVTGDNLAQLRKIKKFVREKGLRFQPTADMHARLNRDTSPCDLRISPEDVFRLNGRPGTGCLIPADVSNADNGLFRCAVRGGDGVHIDPYGNTFLCSLIRKPVFNLLKVELEYARQRLLSLARNKGFTTDSRCKDCRLRDSCLWCPGKACVETGDKEAAIDYYCRLAGMGNG